MSQAWVVELSAVGATGDLTQLYPDFCPTGTDKASASPGDKIRTPMEGKLHSAQVKTDGTNGGIIEVWDLNGADIGADVSSAEAITNAQLTALVAAGKARKLFEQEFAGGSGAATIGVGQYRTFLKGLAARFSNSGPTGDCKLNLVVTGGYRLNESAGL